MGNQGEGETGPYEAGDAVEFVALLRQLKDRSGLTYRQLEERAAEWGDMLPRSTLADALRQDTLPRTEILVAFLRACGREHQTEAWLEARERIAAQPAARPGAQQDQDAEDAVVSPARRGGLRLPSRPRLFTAALAILVLAGGGWLAVAALGDDTGGGKQLAGSDKAVTPMESRSTSPAGGASSPLPPPGMYRVRAAVSSLCLSERDGDSAGNIYQSDCRSSVPTYVLEELDGGAYRLRSLHPVFGYGCLGVDNGSTLGGARMMDDYCGHRGNSERFRIVPAGTPARGYRIKPLHTGDCVSVPGGSTKEWTAVLQLTCDSGDLGQVFRFDPAPSPTAVPTISSN